MRHASLLALFFVVALPLNGQDWTIGVATGPWVFGDFAERNARIQVGDRFQDIRTTLSADTRPGLLVDVERVWNDRFSIRLEWTATRAPLSAKTLSTDDDPSGEGVSLEVGTMDVVSFALPLAWRFNRGGAIRPYLMLGPAYVLYRQEPNDDSGAVPLYEGTRGRFGGMAGAGVEWWWRPRIAVRGEISDIITEAPLERSDFRGNPSSRLKIENPHNVHTSVGLRYRF